MKTQINLFPRSLQNASAMIGRHLKEESKRLKKSDEDTYIPIIHPDSNDAATGIIACFIISILFSVIFILFSK